MADGSVSALWAQVMLWVADQKPGVLSETPGLWKGETDQWLVEVNGHDDEIHELPRFGVRLSHKVFIAFGILTPSGGALAGPEEQDVIDHFKSLTGLKATA